jgi:signal transduction histidine kinase
MARILIVDDQQTNRELLCAYLEGSGHEVLDTDSGQKALEIASQQPPDLVLLDVMMPGMDGFECTTKLKLQGDSSFLPIILLTSLSDRDSRVRGLAAGADEWLTKPIDRQELEMRMRNLLALRAKEQSLARRNLALVELDRFRQEMSELLVHDLKNPLAVIAMNHEYLAGALKDLDHTYVMALEDSSLAVRRMTQLLKNLLDMARLEASRLDLHRAPTNVTQLLQGLADQRRTTAHARNIVIDVTSEPNIQLSADVDLLTRAFENIIDNAFRYTPADGRIAVEAHMDQGQVAIRIGNTGSAIPREARSVIFEKFGQSTHAGRMNLGLGLYFCRLAAEAHGGEIHVEETQGLPTVFVINLPRVG